MIIASMEEFQRVCKHTLVATYNQKFSQKIDLSNVFIVWACKSLQNYKGLLSTTISGDRVYAEYTYNGDKQELYEDFYIKDSNKCYN